VKQVKVWAEDIQIPTYLPGEPDKNPIFLEKRVYQGSSGKVYPHSVIDSVADEKVLKTYRAVYLENEYLKIMVLPELGGRIQRATDKTNNYDFVYYNQVIKPALVGLAGPWTGAGSVICSPECACKMACCLLMTEYPAVDNEVLDAVAEVTNMVIGNFKTLIEPRTGPLGLSIPSVVYGRNFTIRNGVNDEWTVIPFYCGEQQFEIRVCLMRSRGSGRPAMAAAV
jgi:CheY-specific phosphatase CheX